MQKQTGKISVGILAGGKSTRMGRNKALLELNDRSFIQRISDEMNCFSEVLLSAAERGIYEEFGLPVVYDIHREIGPIEGIYQILQHASEEYVFICAADMPFLKKELVHYLAEHISSDYDCYCLADEEHLHPLCAIYSKRMLPMIEKLIEEGEYRLRSILNRVRTKYISLEYTCFEKKVVRNINTREEYRRLVLPVVFCVSGRKDSGKTGLIIRLINGFIQEGYSVSVIKHDGHDYDMDHEGTDTWRFTQAGAECSAIFSDSQYTASFQGRTSIEDMLKLCSGRDIVIIEGMKESDLPKVEVVRREISTEGICNPDTLICLATNLQMQLKVPCPVMELDDTEGIYRQIKKYFGLE